MLRANEIKKQVASRLRELFPRAQEWQELVDSHVGEQTVDVLVRFRMGGETKTLICEVRPVGQPRIIREALMRLRGLREHLPDAHPVVGAPYVSAQSAALIRRDGAGYVDLSGNCYLAFDNVQIEKEGKPNVRPLRRPLKALFAPRATRIVRALLVEPDRSWRLEELGRAVSVSLGHVHAVVQRLSDLEWVQRGREGRVSVQKPGELLDAWRDAHSYRLNTLGGFVSPIGEARRVMGALARAADAAGIPYAFTLHAGVALIGPHVRVPTVQSYIGGDPEPVARALGLQSVEGEGSVLLLTPYDQGVFYAPVEKGGFRVVSLPQLYVDLYHHERRGREQADKLRRDAIGY